MNISKIEFDNLSAVLCGRMVSLDRPTRHQGAKDASALLADLPKCLRNSPHCQAEIEALSTLIARVADKPANIREATADDLDEIMARTAYAEDGVAIGEAAAADQDLRRAAQKEMARRYGYDD